MSRFEPNLLGFGEPGQVRGAYAAMLAGMGWRGSWKGGATGRLEWSEPQSRRPSRASRTQSPRWNRAASATAAPVCASVPPSPRGRNRTLHAFAIDLGLSVGKYSYQQNFAAGALGHTRTDE